jgi:hypothetical protein
MKCWRFIIAEMREQHPMHSTIIVDMWKANPNERISSADVVTRINNLIKFQLRIGLLFQPNFANNHWELGNKILILKC